MNIISQVLYNLKYELCIYIFGPFTFSAIPEDGRRKAYAEAKAKAEEVEEKEVKKLEAKEEAATATPSLAEDVQEKATTAARKSFTELMDRFKSVTQEPEKEEKEEETSEDQNGAPGLAMSWDKLSSGFASAVKRNNIQLPKVQIATDVKYTLIKTKLTDDYSLESSYNVVVNAEGITAENDYKVM